MKKKYYNFTTTSLTSYTEENGVENWEESSHGDVGDIESSHGDVGTWGTLSLQSRSNGRPMEETLILLLVKTK